MGESQEPYAECGEPDPKQHVSCGSVHLRSQNQQSSSVMVKTENRFLLERSGWALTRKGHKGIFLGDGHVV